MSRTYIPTAVVRAQREERDVVEEIACEVWFDLEKGERVLLGRENVCCKSYDAREPMELYAVNSTDRREVKERCPMTPEDRREAERLASEGMKCR